MLSCQKLIYVILYDNKQKFHFYFNPDEESTQDNFKNVSNENLNLFFELSEEIENQQDFGKKKMIIENHFLFIFEIICKDFFEQLIQVTNKKSQEDDKQNQEIQIIQNLDEDNPTKNISFKYLEQVLLFIRSYLSEGPQEGKQLIIFLYCISYLKIYLNYVAKYTVLFTQDLGNISYIINQLKENLSGHQYEPFRKSMYYYIFKSLNYYSGNYKFFFNEFVKDVTFKELTDEIGIISDVINVNELDFPFFDDLNVYTELRKNEIDKSKEIYKNILENNPVEMINYLINTIYVYALFLSKKQDDQTYTNINIIYTECINEVFVNNIELKSCLNFLLEFRKDNLNQFFIDIAELTQYDYIKLLFCFKLLLLISLQGNENIKNTYTKLSKTFKQKNIELLQEEEKLAFMIYLSLDLFIPYLNKNASKEIQERALHRLIYYFDELKSITNVPLEIFLHLFYKYYKKDLNISESFKQTKKDISSFAPNYLKNREEYFEILKDDPKSIIKEIYDPNEYEQLPYLKYFMLSFTVSLQNKHKTDILYFNKEDTYPIFQYLYNEQEYQKLQQLSVLEDLNPFGKEIFEYFIQNPLIENDCNRNIESFLTKDKDSTESDRKMNLFNKFLEGWNKISNSKLFKPPNKEENIPLGKDSQILYCLPQEKEGDKGYQYTYIYRQLIKIHNEIIQKIANHLNSSVKDNKNKYLLSQLNRCIDIYSATKNHIINLKITNNEFNFENTFEMLKYYSERKCFDIEGNFIYRNYRNLMIDNCGFHEHLLTMLLLGKSKFSDFTHYIKILTKEEFQKIQENLNKKQEETKRKERERENESKEQGVKATQKNNPNSSEGKLNESLKKYPSNQKGKNKKKVVY